MKNLKQLSVLLFSLLLFTAFKQDSKLTQEDAEKAIKSFVTFNNASAMGSKVHISEVLSVDKVEQSSHGLATCWSKAKAKVANSDSGNAKTGKDCLATELKIEFYFHKKADNKWILSGISRSASQVKVKKDYLIEFIEKNRGLSIAAQ